MIYNLGGRLQAVDFADKSASSEVLADLQHEFSTAISTTCLLCLLHAHAGSEETGIFPAMEARHPEMIRKLILDHQEISRRLGLLSKMADEISGIETARGEPRWALGSTARRTSSSPSTSRP
jgi:hypothetical protein